MGLLFDNSKNYVVLLEKTKPPFLKGLWNAPGGKVEVGESSVLCCAREFEEETGIKIPEEMWIHIFHIENIYNSYVLDIFCATSDLIFTARTTTEEKVEVIPLKNIDFYQLGPNMNWFIEFSRKRSLSFNLPIYIDDLGGD